MNIEGKTLKKWRKLFGVNQTEFAKALGKDQSYISKMERDHRPVTDEILRAFKKKYKNSIETHIARLNEELKKLRHLLITSKS